MLALHFPILKGLKSYSPGLRGTSYPGFKQKQDNPVRVKSAWLRKFDLTLAGLGFAGRLPRVGAAAPTLGYMMATLSGLRFAANQGKRQSVME
jgi:hypothetical protein